MASINFFTFGYKGVSCLFTAFLTFRTPKSPQLSPKSHGPHSRTVPRARRRRRPAPPQETKDLALVTGHSRSETVPAHYPTPPSEGNADTRILSENVLPHFANDLFDHNNIIRLNSSYVDSTPFKYAVVEKLFQDDLLKTVKDECLSELSFTEKETDIYKVSSLSLALSGSADSVDNQC